MSARRLALEMNREIRLQARLASRDWVPLLLALLFPAMGMILIQYTHRGSYAPLPAVPVELAIQQGRQDDLTLWAPFTYYGTAAGVVFALSVVCLAHTALSLGSAREEGILKHVRATPMRPSAYLGAAIATPTLMGLLASLLVVGIALTRFGVAISALQHLTLMTTVLISAVGFSILGVASSNFLIRRSTAHTTVYLVLLPVFVISSIFTSPHLLIPDMRRIGVWLPLQPVIESLYTIMVSDTLALPRSMWRFLAWVTVVGTLGLWRFRWLPSDNEAPE